MKMMKMKRKRKKKRRRTKTISTAMMREMKARRLLTKTPSYTSITLASWCTWKLRMMAMATMKIMTEYKREEQAYWKMTRKGKRSSQVEMDLTSQAR